MTAAKGNKPAKREADRALQYSKFVEHYLQTGENGTRAVLGCGAFPDIKSVPAAGVQSTRLLKTAKVQALLNKRRAELMRGMEASTAEVIASMMRDVRFDPAKLTDAEGNPLPLHLMDRDTRLALRGHKVETTTTVVKGKTISVTHVTEVKYPDKSPAREQLAKNLGLYKADNSQKPPPAGTIVHMPGVRTFKFEPFHGRKRGAAPR